MYNYKKGAINMYYFFEDKKEVTNALFTALKTTIEGVDIKEMRYDKLENNRETVTIVYVDEHRKLINVSCDSGIALMKDVLRAIAL